jgi:hypothetical protein
MTVHLTKRTAQSELSYALRQHLDIIDSVERCFITLNISKEPFLYLGAIPILYSAWEGFFKVNCSICLRRICIRDGKAKNYSNEYASLWLQREPFMQTFLKSLLNSMDVGRDVSKITAGRFKTIVTFNNSIKGWLDSPVQHAANFDDLLMTQSNVNTEITKLNCNIIGVDLSAVDFSRLDELLGRRNSIAHGGLLTYPSENDVQMLLAYTRKLLTEFNLAIANWIKAS